MQFKGFKSYVLVMVLCLDFALSDGYLLYFVLERTTDIVDIYFDMAGATVYWVGQMVLSRGRWRS